MTQPTGEWKAFSKAERNHDQEVYFFRGTGFVFGCDFKLVQFYTCSHLKKQGQLSNSTLNLGGSCIGLSITPAWLSQIKGSCSKGSRYSGLRAADHAWQKLLELPLARTLVAPLNLSLPGSRRHPQVSQKLPRSPLMILDLVPRSRVQRLMRKQLLLFAASDCCIPMLSAFSQNETKHASDLSARTKSY